MGFFNKIKQFLGIGTVKVHIEAPETFSKQGNSLSGEFILSAKSDQEIISLEVEFEESWKTGRGDNEKTEKFELGKWKDEASFQMKAGDEKRVTFTLDYELLKSENDRMADSAGKAGKLLGGLGKMMDGEKSTYFLTATVDVKGAAFDPNDVKELKLSSD